MKKCNECHKDLGINMFNKCCSSKDGRQVWCRLCQKKKYSEYRKSHPEIINNKWKRYYKRNRVKMIKRTRKYEENLGKEEYVKRYKKYNQNAKFTKYGISEIEYNYLLERQEQKCGMCKVLFDKNKPRSIHIDHNHKTGKVRGILCDGCNLFLGHFESEAYQRRVEQAQTYLRKTEM